MGLTVSDPEKPIVISNLTQPPAEAKIVGIKPACPTNAAAVTVTTSPITRLSVPERRRPAGRRRSPPTAVGHGAGAAGARPWAGSSQSTVRVIMHDTGAWSDRPRASQPRRPATADTLTGSRAAWYMATGGSGERVRRANIRDRQSHRPATEIERQHAKPVSYFDLSAIAAHLIHYRHAKAKMIAPERHVTNE